MTSLHPLLRQIAPQVNKFLRKPSGSAKGPLGKREAFLVLGTQEPYSNRALSTPVGVLCIRLLIVKKRRDRKTPKPSRIKITLTRLRVFLLRIRTRTVAANTMMVLFILLTSIGMFMYSPALGLVVAGVCCGIFGFLLGLE